LKACETKNNNTSLNAEINTVLRKYVEWDVLASKVGMIPIAKPVLSEIFQRIMTKEQVIDIYGQRKRLYLLHGM